ncbi:MAG: hypothetical protein KatS3mg093_015 [Candidatus Parcubacteria bacterium]|nr:MAG: hypothetical protein KatS3mg093_015 [Candidatus Parcubacteria bacterium]
MKKKKNTIEINPKILLGKPVIRGTRIPVSLILNLLANGYTIEKIIETYPQLTKKDIISALKYVQQRLNRENIQRFVATK